MVDLVKIRRKAKEKKTAAGTGEAETTAEVARPDLEPSRKARGPSRSPRRKASREKAPSAAVRPVARDEVTAPESAREAAPPPAAIEKPEEDPRAPEPVEGSVVDAEGDAAVPERLESYRREAGTGIERKSDSVVRANEEGAGENELLTFVIAGEHYAVEIEKIVEIIRPRSATRVPNAAKSIVGIISLRGMIVTLLDLRRILGHSVEVDLGEDARVVVVGREGETAGFLVDRVSRVIKVDPSKIEAHPVVSTNEQSEFVRGVFRHGTELMILLDLEKVLA